MRRATQLRAFERAYRHEGPYVAAVLGRLSVPSEAVHDALQDVFVAAYRRWDDFDDTRPVRPWLTGFARRVAFRYRRSAARRVRKRAALCVTPREETLGAANRVVAEDFLERFLASLPKGHRDVFVASELQGKTAKEIAAECSLGVEAVYGRIRSTRKRLKLALLDDAHEPSSKAASLVPPWGLMLTRLGEAAHVPAAASASLLPLAGLKTAVAAAAVAVVSFGATRSSAEDPPALDEPSMQIREARVDTSDGPRVELPVETEQVAAVEIEEVAKPDEAPDERVQTPARTRRGRPARRAKGSRVDDSLARETTLIRKARAQHRRGASHEALKTLQVHARAFPKGQLADARRRARIRVLCDSGRKDQARREADELARLHPDDPLALQSLSICVR